jgi:hypothetical protein
MTWHREPDSAFFEQNLAQILERETLRPAVRPLTLVSGIIGNLNFQMAGERDSLAARFPPNRRLAGARSPLQGLAERRSNQFDALSAVIMLPCRIPLRSTCSAWRFGEVAS